MISEFRFGTSGRVQLARRLASTIVHSHLNNTIAHTNARSSSSRAVYSTNDAENMHECVLFIVGPGSACAVLTNSTR